MRLLRTKKWNWFDIGLLKASCILFGMLAGAYFAEFVIRSGWMILMTAMALAIKPAIAYLANDED
jgi:hypothetical protein